MVRSLWGGHRVAHSPAAMGLAVEANLRTGWHRPGRLTACAGARGGRVNLAILRLGTLSKYRVEVDDKRVRRVSWVPGPPTPLPTRTDSHQTGDPAALAARPPLALTPSQQASPLARRPYDLRHAAVSLWLNAGLPATEVARRVGHGVAVLLKVYANCSDDQAAANQRISDALDAT